MAEDLDLDLPDFSQIEAFNNEDTDAMESDDDANDSSNDSSDYDSAREDVQDDNADGDHEEDQSELTSAEPTTVESGAAQQSSAPSGSANPTEEHFGYPPPQHLPAAFKRKNPPGRPRLTPHERARREAARALKKAEERAKRPIKRHENIYSKSRRLEVIIYLLTQRVELKETQLPLRMRDGISLGAPERLPGPGEELIRYRPVSFDDAAKRWRIPVSTIQRWWVRREKYLGKDHPELHRKRSFFDVVPARNPPPPSPPAPAQPTAPPPAPAASTASTPAPAPAPTPTPTPTATPVGTVGQQNPPPPRVIGPVDYRPRRAPLPAVPRGERYYVVHLGPPPGVQAYLWELGV